MGNKGVSDFVAASMDAVLKSKNHQSLFGTNYKFASKECDKCHKMEEECTCDNNGAWDPSILDTNDVKDSSSSSSSESDSDCSSSSEEMESSAFDLAIDSLLTASAALDSLGMEKGSTLSLKIASLVVEAKKKEKDTKKMTDAEKAKAKKKKEEEVAKAKKKKEDENEARAKKKKKEEEDKKKSSAKSSGSSSSSSGKKPPFFQKKSK